MVTSPVSSAAASATAVSSASSANRYNLSAQDFIKMMVTQLQQQDPTQPMSNSDLLGQMSQIGQLQSNTQLQTTLSGFAQQTQVGAAAALIGKSVEGLDDNNNPVKGIVSSVSVTSTGANLQLDSGVSLGFGRVTSIGPAPSAHA